MSAGWQATVAFVYKAFARHAAIWKSACLASRDRPTCSHALVARGFKQVFIHYNAEIPCSNLSGSRDGEFFVA